MNCYSVVSIVSTNVRYKVYFYRMCTHIELYFVSFSIHGLDIHETFVLLYVVNFYCLYVCQFMDTDVLKLRSVGLAGRMPP